jgi:DNA repair exonuclease SbcCD ATPase subunit
LGLGDKINPNTTLENVDLALSTPCFQAFFKIVERADTLQASWRTLQDEIAQYKADNPKLPRDLYLTFLLMDAVDADDLRIAQKISADPMVCRKIILYASENSLFGAVESLPFISVDTATAGGAPSVQQTFSALQASGYPARILDAISDRASVDNILSRILDLPVPGSIPSVELERISLETKDPTRSGASRLKKLSITDFRGIRQADIDLSANLTVIYGPNGTGKTSFLDAIEWALLGSVERLDIESADDVNGISPYVNLFSDAQQTKVVLDMEVMRTPVHITRMGTMARDTTLSVDDRENTEDRQLLTLITGQEGAKLDLRILRRLVRNTCFLSQSTLKGFLSNDPAQRYASLSYLLGTQDYMRVLDKLQEIRAELDFRIGRLHEQSAAFQKDVSVVTEQIDVRRSLLVQSSTLRELDTGLQELVRRTADALRIAASPYTDLFRSVTGYEEMKSSVSITTDWVEKELGRRRDETEKTTAAKEALARANEITIALATTSTEHQRTTDSIKHQIQEVSSKRSRRDERHVELNSVSEKIQRLTHRQNQLREAIVIVSQMVSIAPLLREQEQQVLATNQALQDTLNRKTPMGLDLDSATKAHSDATEKLKKLKAQLKLIDELESSSTSYIQLLQERPSLYVSLRSARQESVEQQAAKTSAMAQLAGLREELRSNEAERDKELRSVEKSRTLLLELQQYLVGPDCPLCGHPWQSLAELTDAINERSSWISPQLRELEQRAKELHRRLEVAEMAIRSCDQEIAVLIARQTDLEARLRHADEIEQSYRYRLEQLGIPTREFAETFSEMAKLRTTNDLETAPAARDVATLEMRVRQLRDAQLSVDSETTNLEAQRDRAISRLADTQRRENDLRRQFSDLELELPADQLVLEHQLAADIADAAQLGIARASLQVELEALDANLQRLTLELESLKRKEAEYLSNSQTLRAILDRATAVLTRAEVALHTPENEVALKIERAKSRVANLDRAKTNLQEMDQITSWLISRREIDELTSKLSQLSAQMQGILRESEKLQGWNSHISGLFIAILDAKAKVETIQLTQYGPTINLLYQRLNTHPLFREIKILVDTSAQAVRINVCLPQSSGPQDGIKSLPPALYLSEAQLNVVALTIFLSHSFQQRWSRFSPLLLDDPVMNLDDFNANGLIDCLRAFAENDRQFVVSTCDISFYRLLLVKLRCMNENGRIHFRAYRLDGISTAGPILIEDYPAPGKIPATGEVLVQ